MNYFDCLQNVPAFPKIAKLELTPVGDFESAVGKIKLKSVLEWNNKTWAVLYDLIIN